MANGTDQPSDLIRINEAAKLLRGTHANTLRRWIHQGKLKGWQLGQFYLVSRAEVLDMIQPVEVGPAPDGEPRPRTARQRKRDHRLAMQRLEAAGAT